MRPIIFALMFIILLAGLVTATAVPSIPNYFQGKVTYSGSPSASLVDYGITATVGGNPVGLVGSVKENATGNNSYKIKLDPKSYRGQVVFYVGGVEASPKATYDEGGFTTLDLTIDEFPGGNFCGNEVKETGEQCDGRDLNREITCADVVGAGWTGTLGCTNSCTFDIIDCVDTSAGVTPPASTGGSGGGSGGGGGGSSSGSSSSSSSSSSGSGSGSSSSGGSVDNDPVETVFWNNNSESSPDTNDQEEAVVLENSQSSFNSGFTGAFTALVKNKSFLPGLVIFAAVAIVFVGMFLSRSKKVKKEI